MQLLRAAQTSDKNIEHEDVILQCCTTKLGTFKACYPNSKLEKKYYEERVFKDLSHFYISREVFDNEFAEHIEYALEKNAKVFCSTVGNCYCYIGERSQRALEMAHNKDMLVILDSCDQGGMLHRRGVLKIFMDCEEKYNLEGKLPTEEMFASCDYRLKLKKNLPNVIMTFACCYARCCENLIDLSVEPTPKRPESAVCALADLTARIRLQRPHLKAIEVKKLLLEKLGARILNYEGNPNTDDLYELILKETN